MVKGVEAVHLIILATSPVAGNWVIQLKKVEEGRGMA